MTFISTNYICEIKNHSRRFMLGLAFILLLSLFANAQQSKAMRYESSTEHPFGQVNPDAPKELADYAPMIGICDCKTETAKADGSWTTPENMTWMFKYIMNGMAVQDQTLKESGSHSGSIRQFSADSSQWYVHYYSTGKISSVSKYKGGKVGKDIVLYKTVSDITLEDGTPAYYRLTFSDISNDGFKWRGEWVNSESKPDQVLAETWRINCKKRKE